MSVSSLAVLLPGFVMQNVVAVVVRNVQSFLGGLMKPFDCIHKGSLCSVLINITCVSIQAIMLLRTNCLA